MWQTVLVLIVVILALAAAVRRSARVLRGSSECACSGGCSRRDAGCGR